MIEMINYLAFGSELNYHCTSTWLKIIDINYEVQSDSYFSIISLALVSHSGIPAAIGTSSDQRIYINLDVSETRWSLLTLKLYNYYLEP